MEARARNNSKFRNKEKNIKVILPFDLVVTLVTRRALYISILPPTLYFIVARVGDVCMLIK